MPTIKKISATDTIAIRHCVLRKNKPVESCYFDNDDLFTTMHFGVFEHNVLCGVISVYENKHNDFQNKHHFQIRGMAVLSAYQKLGYGKTLVISVENYLQHYQNALIWFNARTTAVGFYEKLGYEQHGAVFDILDVGRHVVMFKST